MKESRRRPSCCSNPRDSRPLAPRGARAAAAPGARPLGTGVLRTSPEDFGVDEILGFDAGGEGPHALLHVRKRGANTEWVARELARAAGCKPFEVGFAGLKDRNAVTTQHFTVPRGKRAARRSSSASTGEGYEVIARGGAPAQAAARRARGQPLRDHGARRRLRPAALGARIAAIAAGGVPNYFGEQRFGRDAGNLAAACCAAPQRGRRRGEARARARPRRCGIHAVRGAQPHLQRHPGRARGAGHAGTASPPGDVANLDGRGSVFAVTRSMRSSPRVAPRSTCIRPRRSPGAGNAARDAARCWRSKRASRRGFPKRSP